MGCSAGRIVLASLCAILLTIGLRLAPSQAEEGPPDVFIDAGACPFECCTYREWFADRDITLWDRPNSTQIVAHLRKDDAVDGLTGEVHSIPLRVTAGTDLPLTAIGPAVAGNAEAPDMIKAGDVFYVLHYAGEGVWKVWHRGKVAELEVADETGTAAKPSPASWPRRLKSTWWVQVRTRQGVVGWTVSKGNFRNQDQCG
ncbi:MAG TPA: hypothetical protein VJ747_09970 [Stellaceae bacterium]|nr:hypothetical protein [Stellaceae bacterium]